MGKLEFIRDHVSVLQKKYKLNDFEIGLYWGFFRGANNYDVINEGEGLIRFERFIKRNIKEK